MTENLHLRGTLRTLTVMRGHGLPVEMHRFLQKFQYD
ncbi:hypothetical protein MY11210_008072 [Beauveria gryllotalpidicola]